MPQQPGTKSARHGRLFELLRQNNQAETVRAKTEVVNASPISANELIKLQRAAFRSLQAPA